MKNDMELVRRHDCERLPQESVKAFTAFRTYLNLGPERSLAAVAAKLGKSKVLMERWSRRYDWSGRLAACAQHSSPTNSQPSTPRSTITQQRSTNLPFAPARKESHKAFAAFLAFLDLGGNRSLARVARALRLSRNTVKAWAHRFDWPGRVRAYNTHLLHTRVSIETDATRDQAQLWAARTAAFKELEWLAAEKLLLAARRHLDALLAAEPGKITLAEIARALDIASKIGRLATGLATAKQELTGPEGGPIRLEFEAALRKVYGPVVDVEPAPPSPIHPQPRTNSLISVDPESR